MILPQAAKDILLDYILTELTNMVATFLALYRLLIRSLSSHFIRKDKLDIYIVSEIK